MNMITITGMAVIAAAFSVLLKNKNPEYSMLLSLTVGVLIIGMLITAAMPIFDWVRTLFVATGTSSEYVQVLFKALGICFITQIACDSCRDLGETAIASKVETAGKISVLLISLPLFQQVLEIVKGLMG